MSGYPNLSSYGYIIEAELGRNREGGRITWKAQEIETQKTVVIKQFCFAQAGSSWSGYKAYTQEIEILQKLSHPNIPQYLDSIETDNGFCLVQEYIAGVPSSDFGSLTTAQVKQVAQKTLDILIYLQQQVPPILHRDISTDNILLDESLNVYLVDFGFSSLGSKEVSASSVFLGTPGFIAPEQIIKPCMASDLYGLGVSLVCLLTHSDIAQVRQAASADDPYQLDLNSLLPDLDRDFRAWLDKMIHSKVSQRFADAKSAKEALQGMDSALTWWEDKNDIVEDRSLNENNLTPKIFGGLAISSVTMVATWSLAFAASRVELTFIGTAIAIIATFAIAVTQLGAASIASSDDGSKVEGVALSLIIPTVLVCASGLIWGIEETIIIAAAIALSETLLLSYFWWQLFSNNSNSLAKSSFWLSAIAIGISLGMKLI